MKKIKYLGLELIFSLACVSCNDWLDVNENPNTPTNTVASVETRLPWIQHFYGYAYGAASMRVSWINGTITSRNGFSSGSTHTYMPVWNPSNGVSVTPYQQWFVGAAANIEDLKKKAEETQAYHYTAATLVIEAMGYMLMTDLYGEMPFREAVGAQLTPKYDDGKTIYEGCLQKLDEALSYFDKEQPSTAPPLSKGDNWNNGDLAKWKAMVYGLKARWLNKASKKTSYNPDAVLDALSKAPSTNNMSAVVHHLNLPGDLVGPGLNGDPVKTSYFFNVFAWSDHIRLQKWYTDKLEYTEKGRTHYDPRRHALLPANQHYNADGTSYFMITAGVDELHSDIHLKSGPVISNYNSDTKSYKAGSTIAERSGDTVYVTLRSICAVTGSADGESMYKDKDGTILSTGTFYTRPEAPTHLLTYSEMCFIKAEVLFRKGDRAGAHQAYKAGILADMELMNQKLNAYADKNNPGKKPMTDQEISDFMKSEGVCQDAAKLTMEEIMKQKFIVMTFTVENWNDMRRFNYSAGNIGNFGVVYPGFERPKAMPASATTDKFPGASKVEDNYWWRRFMHCSHEVNYNAEQWKASNPKADKLDIWSVPVWWDSAE